MDFINEQSSAEKVFVVQQSTVVDDVMPAGTGEQEEEPMPIFAEPVDARFFDEFSLKQVLDGRQHLKKEEIPSTAKPPAASENSSLSKIVNIEKMLNFEEDVSDFALVDEYNNKALGEEGGTAKVAVKQAVVNWADKSVLPASEYEKLRPNLAMEYPFELDTFQQQAVMRLERRENVFVAAHTSAGKTVVAEYAIALALKNNTRSIYTSPIKALSNQKYRDFRDKFGVDNVGIITGDVSVNPNAPCLIMTTEIFRSMLYKGADTIRDIEFVIFDEVHYVNDAERGVVWEEVIIMLPEHVCLIFLSATTPNSMEFSEWIGRTKHRKVYVMTTNKRPVPLQHYLLHDFEMYKMLQGEVVNYNPGALQAANKHLREKNKPKPMTAENAKFQSQRQGEKQANAARNAGVSVNQLQGRGGRGGGYHGGRGGGGPAGRGGAGGRGGNSGGGRGGGGGDVAGGKAQWNSLLKILQAGGREAAGGLGKIDFGVATASNVLSEKARAEKNTMVKYEKLPAELKAKMSKKEYESQQFRGDEDEGENGTNDGSVGLLPVVVFSFSKKKCEEIADFLKGQDLLTNREKGKVKMLLNEVLSRLNPADAELPQVLRLKDMLCRGIGVHHGGLLPILKETVEILFAESIVKVLFATETFAMGVNMPARSVVFNGFSKHDGKSRRDLLPGEYTQMAGRAGRRGLDEVGTVILAAWTNLPEELQLKKLLTGTATRLSSQFRMRYNMILNLVRVNNLSVEDMMKRSFTEYHTQKALASNDLVAKLRKYEALVTFFEAQQAERADFADYAPAVNAYLSTYEACRELHYTQLKAALAKNKALLSTLLCPGRLIEFHCEKLGAPAFGMLISTTRTAAQDAPAGSGNSKKPTVSATSGIKLSSDPPSAMQLERMKLTQKHDEKFGTSAAAAAAAAAGGGGNTSEEVVDGDLDAYVWVFVPLTPEMVAVVNENNAAVTAAGAAGGAAAALQSVVSDVVDLSHPFAETLGTVVEGEQAYLVTRVHVKHIAGIVSMTLTVGANHSTITDQSHAHAHAAQQLSVVSFAYMMSDVQSNDATGTESSTYFVDLLKECRNMNDLDFGDNQMKLRTLWKKLCPLRDGIPNMVANYRLAYKLYRAQKKADVIRHYISDKNMSLFPDFQQRIKVLALLGYVDRDCKVITQKGRAACELNSCDELLGTEILFNNILEPLNPPEAAAMLAALVFQEKVDGEDALTSRMEVAKTEMTAILEQLNNLQEIEGVVMDPDSKPILNFGLCAVVYQWARGMSFRDITQLTAVQEGTIVRAITRLDELCRDFRNAAVVIGNPSLYRKMEAASLCIKRDIVFAGSLYLT